MLRIASEEAARRAMMDRLRRGGLLSDWTGTWTSEAERVVLSKYHDALTGRVLEFGIGGGRLTSYLIEIADTLHGVDIADDMVTYCREHYPAGTFVQEDLRNLSAWGSDAWDAIYGGYNTFDTLSCTERDALFADVARLLRPGGLFIFSSHNRGTVPLARKPWDLVRLRPRRLARWLVQRPRAILNYSRLAAFQHVEEDYAIVVDEALDYGLLQIYIGRDAQQRQLAKHGLVLLDCFDDDGAPVDIRGTASWSVSLTYVARSAGSK
jgi:SAM-dependent methyltransferase